MAAEQCGTVLVAEHDRAFAGLAAGWIAEENNIEETPDSNRFGLTSDISCYRPSRPAPRHAHGASRRRLVSRIRPGLLVANTAICERSGFAPHEIVYEKVLPARTSRVSESESTRKRLPQHSSRPRMTGSRAKAPPLA
jgi:hypothetical protein